MKYVLCQNSNSGGKYFRGRLCHEEILVDDAVQSVLCWKCTALLTPPPEEKKPSGYPRGWKFMIEFVDKDGNVYHKGELQNHLFGKLPPTDIKKTDKKDPSKQKKKKSTIDDKIIEEFKKIVSNRKNKKTKRSR
jgi:hypothetical protein